jgi:spore coat polysaccharide biosynthesis predicted glycosyltransferase SpsG
VGDAMSACQPSTLVVRADTRPGVGQGHAMRGLALGERWANAGGEAVLVLDQPSSCVRTRAEASGVAVEDAGPVAELSARDPDWLVLDGYGFGAVAGVPAARTVVVDDHGYGGHHDAAVIVDQNLGADARCYGDRPAGSTLLLGPRYALLRPDLTPPDADRTAAPRRMLVALGGDPPADLVDLAVQVGAEATRRLRLEVDVVGGGELGPLIGIDGVNVHGFVPDIAPLLAHADIALAAAGTTTWELCRYGIPAVLIAAHDNQRPVAHSVSAEGAGVAAAGGDQAVDLLARLCGAPDLRLEMSDRARRLVDGRGAARVVAAIRSRSVHLREADTADEGQLWEWANDPETRAASFQPEPIPVDEHRRWFADRQQDPDSRIYVAEEGGVPWGVIRFEHGRLSVSIDRGWRGQGRAAPLIRAGTRRVFADEPGLEVVRADVRPENRRSQAAFDLAGFEPGESFIAERSNGW